MQLTIILACLMGATSAKFYRSPEVNTSQGTVIGKIEYLNDKPVKTFQGIPYAKPPTSDNRFKRTIPVESWNGTLVADKLPPACEQHSPNPFPWLDILPNKSLDCLYLNLWAPYDASPYSPKAVMFWIHGGGYRIGSSRLDYYNGTPLAALGDVIVVSLNYRLGVEGFLDSGTDEAPGNMGLYDILEGLKWVRSNICNFGGDRNRVTIFGQSSGAITAGMFMTSPLAKNLFVRAIFQSGSPTNLDAEDNDRDFTLSEGIAKYVGCMSENKSLKNNSASVVNCLRSKDPSVLAEAMGKVSDNPQRGLYPKYADDILPENVRESFLEGHFENMDILIGNVANEGPIMITKANRDVFGFFGESISQINKTFGEYLLRKGFRKFSNSTAVVEHYLGSISDEDQDRVIHQVQSALGDVARVCPSVYLAERVAQKGNRVFYYYFDHRPSNSPWAPWMGVPHFDETPFVFGYPLRYPDNYTQEEQELSRTVIAVWTNFAKTGRQVLQPWPLYSRETQLYRTLGIASSIGSGPHHENCEFFRPYFGF